MWWKNILDSMVRFFNENALVKLISLVLAVLVWFYINGLLKVQKVLNVPLELINLPKGFEIVNKANLPKYVQVNVSIPKRKYDNFEFSSKDFVAYVDLASPRLGLSKYNVYLSSTLPEEIYVFHVPSEVFVDIDVVITQQVKILFSQSNFSSDVDQVVVIGFSRYLIDLTNIVVKLESEIKTPTNIQIHVTNAIDYYPKVIRVSGY